MGIHPQRPRRGIAPQMAPITATFDEYAIAVADWAASWLWPVTLAEAAEAFGISPAVTEAAIVHCEGVAIGDGDVILTRPHVHLQRSRAGAAADGADLGK